MVLIIALSSMLRRWALPTDQSSVDLITSDSQTFVADTS
jgi:hypothetical protein